MAVAVYEAAHADGVARVALDDPAGAIRAAMWQPTYDRAAR